MCRLAYILRGSDGSTRAESGAGSAGDLRRRDGLVARSSARLLHLATGGLSGHRRPLHSGCHLAAFPAHDPRLYPDLRPRHHPADRRPLYLRRGASRLLDARPLRAGAKRLRPHRTLRPGVRPGDDRTRDSDPAARRSQRPLALLHHRVDLPRHQRSLRAARVARLPRQRLGRRCVPRHPGGRLGHPGRYGHGACGSHAGASSSGPLARPVFEGRRQRAEGRGQKWAELRRPVPDSLYFCPSAFCLLVSAFCLPRPVARRPARALRRGCGHG